MKLNMRDHCQPDQSRLYCQVAHLYDQTFGRILTSRVQQTIRSLELTPGAQVLDVGIGTGN